MLSRLFSWNALKVRIVRSLEQDGSPKRLARSVAIGAFCGILPFPGHTFVAATLAFIFRLNLVAAVAGAWVNFPLIMPLTYAGAFFVGEQVTGTEMPEIVLLRLLDVRYWWPLFRTYFYPMFVGTAIVGAVGALGAYVVALRVAQRYEEKRLRRKLHRGDVQCSEPMPAGELHEPQ